MVPFRSIFLVKCLSTKKRSLLGPGFLKIGPIFEKIGSLVIGKTLQLAMLAFLAIFLEHSAGKSQKTLR